MTETKKTIKLFEMIYTDPLPGTPLELQGEIKVDLYDATRNDDETILESKKLIHLVRWPQMSLLPPNYLAICARVCALLARKPSASFLIHRRLNLPAQKVGTVLLQLHAYGYIATTASQCDFEDFPKNTKAESKPQIQTSIWTKLIHRIFN
jgi:hypothetical protein